MGTTTKPILNLVFPPELLARIDDFWHEHKFISRSEAIRWLITKGLDRKTKPKKAQPVLKEQKG